MPLRRNITCLVLSGLACLQLGDLSSAARPARPVSHSRQAPRIPAASVHQRVPPPPAVQSLPLLSELPGHGAFVMSSCTDAQGRLWIGSEDEGLFCYDARLVPSSRWQHFTKSDGLGDDTGYALCLAPSHALWCGTDRSGVCVWNNKTFKTYDQVTGPLGAHVYAMAVSPVSGDIWIATEGGLSRYQAGKGWSYEVAPGGHSLPPASCLTFNRQGDIVVGTQTDGIVIGRAASNFEKWDKISGPDSLPQGVDGPGLPSSQINCLLTAKDYTLWAGTHDGLAESLNGGGTWQFCRGADYKDKYAGLYQNRQYDATVSGLELMSVSQYQALMGAVKTASNQTPSRSSWISVDATTAPDDQLGVHIAVDGGTVVKGFTPTVDISRVRAPGPTSLYHGEREGQFTYTFSNLVPSQQYMLRMHCIELDYLGPGQRIFTVAANNATVLPGMDIFDTVHAQNKADAEDVPVYADNTGTLRIAFTGLKPVSMMRPQPPAPSPNQMMSQDYVTCLAQDKVTGRIFVGHWQNALESFDPTADVLTFAQEPQVTASAKAESSTFVTCLMPLAQGGMLVGGYGTGITYAGLSSAVVAQRNSSAATAGVPPREAALPFPEEAKPPTREKMIALEKSLSSSGLANMTRGDAAFVSSDWSTRGDWVGRYGRSRTLLCASSGVGDHDICNDVAYDVSGDIGPNRQAGDGMRRWIQWTRSADSRVLFDPVVGYRRESEYDDHAETYDMTSHDGPDLWVTVSVPEGIHRLSAYFVNKDGHDGSNRYRDYKLDLLTYHADPGASALMKPLASARVRQFWDGVYQSFVVCGPAKYYLKVGRNGSFNTILCAVFLDKLSGPETQWQKLNLWSPYFHAPEYKDYIYPPSSGHVTNHVAGLPDVPPPPVDPSPTMAQTVWDKLGTAMGNTNWAAAVVPARILCYRSLAAAHRTNAVPSDSDRLEWWRRNLPFETDDDRAAFLSTMARGWADELKLEPELDRTDL